MRSPYPPRSVSPANRPRSDRDRDYSRKASSSSRHENRYQDEPRSSRNDVRSGPDKKRTKRYHRAERSRKNEEDEDEETLLDLVKLGIEPITEDDYFLRSSEYRYWLKEERGRYLDELSSEDAHKYFRRFTRRWNDGALKERYYFPPKETISTRHQWSFRSKGEASKPSTSTTIPPRSHRHSSSPPPGPPAPDSDSDEIGPSLPVAPISRPKGTADRQLAADDARLLHESQRKSEKLERYRRADEAVPRSSGKEGKMEEKRATNASNKEMRDKDPSGVGLEVDEGTLMGDQGGFAAALRARDGAKNRREEQKAAMAEDRRIADSERLAERRQKETDTMAMFRAMAKERFG